VLFPCFFSWAAMQWLATIEPARVKALDFALKHKVREDDVKALVAAGALAGSVHRLTGVRVDENQPVVNHDVLMLVVPGTAAATALGVPGAPRTFNLLGAMVRPPPPPIHPRPHACVHRVLCRATVVRDLGPSCPLVVLVLSFLCVQTELRIFVSAACEVGLSVCLSVCLSVRAVRHPR
jgi:hypothetical protein